MKQPRVLCVYASMKRVIVSLTAMFMTMHQVHAQMDPDSLFSSDLLKEDLHSLRTTILKTHVDPFIFCTEEEFERAFAVASEQVSNGMTVKSFAAVVGNVMQVMRDSHSGLNYGYLEDQLLNFGERKLLFHAVSNGEGVFVADDILEELQPGSQLISINGIGIEQLHNRFLNYSSIEGNSIVAFHRIADALIGPLGGMEMTVLNENKIEVIPPGTDSIVTISYPGLKEKQLKLFKKLWTKYHGRSIEKTTFDLEYPEEDVAVLTIGSFSEGSPGYYNNFLRRSFSEINTLGIENLIIDIRYNTGGQSVRMEQLLAYLCDDQPSVPDNIIARQSPLARERVEKIYKGLNKFMIDHFFGKNEEVLAFRTMMQMNDGDLDTLYFRTPEQIKPELRYHGKCYLMMNGMSASASVNFAAVFKRMNRGLIVGESCLGPVSGTWGNPSLYKMENTKMEVMISTIRFNADGTFTYESEPIQPDYEVPVSPVDLSNNRDSQIEFILEMIRTGKVQLPQENGTGSTLYPASFND